MKNRDVKYLDPRTAYRVRYFSEQAVEVDNLSMQIKAMPTSEKRGMLIEKRDAKLENIRLFRLGLILSARVENLSDAELKPIVSFIQKQKYKPTRFIFSFEWGKLRRRGMDAEDKEAILNVLSSFLDRDFFGKIYIDGWDSPPAQIIIAPKGADELVEDYFQERLSA